MFHILDIDNTLFFTNDLNNKAYIFALSLLGLKALAPCKRITRTVVALWYPSLTNAEMIDIVQMKQTVRICILSVLMKSYISFCKK